MAEDHIPTDEEYALFREAYAETYPVRPLLNAIDAKDAEIKRLQRALTERPVTSRLLADSGRLLLENERLLAALSAWHKEIVDGCGYDYDGTGWGDAMRAVWKLAQKARGLAHETESGT